MRSHHLLPWVILTVVALGLGVAGCNEEGLDTRNIVEIVSLNGNTPLNSDVWEWIDPKDPSKGGGIPKEFVEVVFQSRPHDGALTVSPGEPFGSVRFYEYDIEFLDPRHEGGVDLNNDGNVDLANFTAPWNAVVPIGQQSVAYLEIISYAHKATPPVSCLGPIGGSGCNLDSAVQYAVNVNITFRGIEETSGEDITLKRGLLVTLAELMDE
jgi:hypothetical protein